MRHDKTIKLIAVTRPEEGDAVGDLPETTTSRTVLAEKKSIRQSEFYQAAATGLKPELTFIVWGREYRGEERVEYQGREYTVIRTFERSDERTELTCEGTVNY